MGRILLSAAFAPALPVSAEKQSHAAEDFAPAPDVLSRLYLRKGEAEQAIKPLYRLLRALQSSGCADATAEVSDPLKMFDVPREKLGAQEAEAGNHRFVEEPTAQAGK